MFLLVSLVLEGADPTIFFYLSIRQWCLTERLTSYCCFVITNVSSPMVLEMDQLFQVFLLRVQLDAGTAYTGNTLTWLTLLSFNIGNANLESKIERQSVTMEHAAWHPQHQPYSMRLCCSQPGLRQCYSQNFRGSSSPLIYKFTGFGPLEPIFLYHERNDATINYE